jgi:predicted amidohydrolase
MRVAAIQHHISWENPAASFEIVRPMIAEAVEGGAELVVLTEMFSTGFSMNASQISEPLDGPAASFLQDQASLHGITIAGSAPTKHPSFELPVNLLTVAEPSGETHWYAKIHPFSYSGEDQHYSPGTEFCTVTIGGMRCTFFICYDLRFADEFWATASGTDMYVIVANWPAARQLHWDALLRARAIENQAFVLAANRVGLDGNGHEYTGGSVVIDPLGLTLDSAHGEPAVVMADVDADTVDDVRRRFPFAADRR